MLGHGFAHLTSCYWERGRQKTWVSMQDMASQFQCGCESCSHWRVSLHENLTGLAMLSEADCSIVWMDYIQPSEDLRREKRGLLKSGCTV